MARKKLVDGRDVEGSEISHRISELLEELGKLTKGDSLIAELERVPPCLTVEPKSNRIRELEAGSDRLIRLKEVLELIPVGKSTWWSGVKSRRYPAPVKNLGPRITAWTLSSILQLVNGEVSQ